MSEMSNGADGESLGAALVDVLSKENATLKDEVAHLESELERRVRVLNEKYAALERDRDNVERIMREAGQRADQNEHNLKVVLEREAALKEKLEKTRAESEATHTLLCQMTHARDVACAESAERLRNIKAANDRADLWQAAAADALTQLKALQGAK